MAGGLLDHVGGDPPEGAWFTPSGQPGVAETSGRGRLPARLALLLPCGQVGVPVSAEPTGPACLRASAGGPFESASSSPGPWSSCPPPRRSSPSNLTFPS